MHIPSNAEIVRATMPGTMAHALLTQYGETQECLIEAMRCRTKVPLREKSRMRATRIMAHTQTTVITLSDRSALVCWETYGEHRNGLPSLSGRTFRFLATTEEVANKLFWDGNIPTVTILSDAKGLH